MHYKIAICEDSVADQTYIRKLAEHWAEDLQHTVQEYGLRSGTCKILPGKSGDGRRAVRDAGGSGNLPL